MKVLTREFFLQDTLTCLKESIGKLLIRRLENKFLIGRIVEAEAYLQNDKACHAYRFGKTKRTQEMYGIGGIAYIFSVHTHNQFCFVTQDIEIPEAILIRAIEPIEGIEIMQKNRGIENIYKLCNGPGNLCKSLQIDKSLYGTDLTNSNSELFMAEDEFKIKEEDLVFTNRVGIDYAEEDKNKPWRVYIKGSKFISRK